MNSEVLTIDEVAKFLRVSPDTIYRLASRGELAGRKIGRIWRIPKSAVEQYLHCMVPAGTSSTHAPVVRMTPPANSGSTQGRSP
jgi:PTS system nitrogen regulatory IIA component